MNRELTQFDHVKIPVDVIEQLMKSRGEQLSLIIYKDDYFRGVVIGPKDNKGNIVVQHHSGPVFNLPYTMLEYDEKEAELHAKHRQEGLRSSNQKVIE